MSARNATVKTTPLGGKVWFCALFFGLIGQIAWIVENMYFAKFMQDEFVDEAWATTLMVALSAIAATAATVVTGAICDKTGKRSVFVSWGFIVWGLTIMVFALFPTDYSPDRLKGLVAAIVIMDCFMSWVGSSANDAAFNTWVTDMTDTTNRGKLDTILSMMPVFAMVIVFIGLDSLTAKSNAKWWLFFVILGAIPIVSGALGLLILRDKPDIPRHSSSSFGKDLVYGFRPSVIKNNKMLYIALIGSGIAGASMQVYMSYLINFVERTLGMTDYVVPLGVIIVCAALLAGLLGFLMDKFGKYYFYIPVVLCGVVGTLSIYFLRYVPFEALMAPLIIAGVVTMASELAISGLFVSSFRDYIPKGKEGCFQGIRMFLFVMLPMIIGPAIGNAIIDAYGFYAVHPETGEMLLNYPYEMFLGAAIVSVFTLIPAVLVMRKEPQLRARLVAERAAETATDEQLSEANAEDLPFADDADEYCGAMPASAADTTEESLPTEQAADETQSCPESLRD